MCNEWQALFDKQRDKQRQTDVWPYIAIVTELRVLSESSDIWRKESLKLNDGQCLFTCSFICLWYSSSQHAVGCGVRLSSSSSSWRSYRRTHHPRGRSTLPTHTL